MRVCLLTLFFFSFSIPGFCQSYVNAFRIGNANYDEGRGIVTDVTGNVYTTGYFTGTADFDPSAATYNLSSNGDYDIYVAKYNSSGTLLWAFNLGSSLKDIGFSIDLDGSNNIYISGYYQGTVDFDPGVGTANLSYTNLQEIFIAKYNSSGVYQWAYSMGSTGNDLTYKLSVDGSDNLLIAGDFNGTVDFDPGAGTTSFTSAGAEDVFIAKYNSSGIFQWAIQIGAGSADIGYGIYADDIGNIFVTGGFQGTADFDPGAGVAPLTSNGALDIFVAKYNSSGAYLWAINIGGATTDNGYGIRSDNSGNVVVTGAFQGTVDFDPSAGTASLSATSADDIFLAKYSSTGAYQWAFKIGSSAIDYGIELDIDGDGNIFTTGYFSGTADFDPGAGTANISTNGGNDIYLAKYSTNGEYLWAFKTGGTGSDVGRSVFLDGTGNIYCTGYFESTADFDPNAGTANLTSLGFYEVYISKYYEPIPASTPIFSGFEACDPALSFDGVQIPFVSSTSPANGSNHGQINGGCGGGSAGCYDGSIISPLLSFRPGCTYNVKVYAKTPTGDIGNLTISKAVTATNSSIKAAAGPDIILASTPVSSSTYTLYTASFTVNSAESKYIGFQLYRAGAGGTGGAQMMIEDISITKDDCGHCSNGLLDGDETSVDCGGSCSSPAPVGGTVSPNSISGSCSATYTLALCGHTGTPQWQFSRDGSVWYDISGEDWVYLKGSAEVTTFFRVKVSNDGCTPAPAYSNTTTVTITGISENVWEGNISTAWTTAGNWSLGIPSNCHNVTIPTSPAGGLMPEISGNAQCNNLTIQNGAILTQNTAGFFFDIYGDITNEGTYNYSTSTTDPRFFGGMNFIGSTGTFTGGARKLAFMANAKYFLNSSLSLNGIDILSGGQLSLMSNYLTITTSFVQNGVLNLNTGTLELQPWPSTFTPSGLNHNKGTFYYNISTNYSFINDDDYYNVRIGSQGGGFLTTHDILDLTFANDFTIDANHTLVTYFLMPPETSFPISIGGNFVSNGNIINSFIDPSTFIFFGTNPQSIGGTSVTTFNNLTINNKSGTGVTLNSPANVDGILTLTYGNLYTSTANILTMEAGSTVSPAGGSANSFVDGPIRKTGNTAFIFPAGDNMKWRRIAISAPSLPTDEFEAEYRMTGYGAYTISSAECIANELKEVSSSEYWNLKRNSGASSPQVTMYWEDASTSNINDCNDLQIAFYDPVNGWWENNNFNDVTVTGACTGSSSGSIQSNTGVIEFNVFTFGSKSAGAPNSFTNGCIPPDLFWVGGASGNWNVAANWSSTSGGAGGAGIPGINTNVYIDNNSGSSVITLPSGTWYTKGFSMSGAGVKSSIIGVGVLLPRP